MKDRFGRDLIGFPMTGRTISSLLNEDLDYWNGLFNQRNKLSDKYTDRLDTIIENHFKPLRDFCKLGITFKETDKEYIYTADLVGLDKDKLHLQIEGLKATLSYDNPEDTRRQKFSYTFELPEIADIETVYTSYENGELKIEIAKLKRKIKSYSFN
jgi:HSP20 family molecular chaperone IbpA